MLVDTPPPAFGSSAPDFDLATPDGTRHTRDGLIGLQGLLVAFICNHCPYVIDLIDRLVADATHLQAKGVGVAFIMSNDYTSYPADAPDRMVHFAATHGFTAPYLIDADQSVARAYGAVCTPDFFGYDGEGALIYRGRLDNIGMRGDATHRVPELRDAMTLGAPKSQTPSMGCSIKWA